MAKAALFQRSRLWNYSYSLLATLVVPSTIVGGGAMAQIGPNADIIGYNLSMTQSQARSHISPEPGHPVVIDLQTNVSSNGYAVSVNAGFVKELRNDNPSAQFGVANHVDRIKVLFDPLPNSSDIFAISRTIVYTPQDQALHTSVVDALTQKYGRPTSAKTWAQGDTDYVWASNPAAYNPSVCGPDTHSYRPYYYEDVWDDRPLRASVGETSQGLVNEFTAYGSRMISTRAGCGTILTVSIRDFIGSAREFVYSMRETLVDTSRGASDLGRFSSMVRSGADSAHKRELDQAQSNKPTL